MVGIKYAASRECVLSGGSVLVTVRGGFGGPAPRSKLVKRSRRRRSFECSETSKLRHWGVLHR